jgi:hypothetical protein
MDSGGWAFIGAMVIIIAAIVSFAAVAGRRRARAASAADKAIAEAHGPRRWQSLSRLPSGWR